jgi:hypothetical protein
MSQRPDDFYADVGALGAADELRPIYEWLEDDARAWSITVGDETPLIAFARSLPRRSFQETLPMQSQPERPEWAAPQRSSYSNPARTPQEYAPEPRPSRLRAWVAVIAAALVVALLGGSFYALQATRNGGTTGAPTATTAQATNTPSPRPTATPAQTATASQLAACGFGNTTAFTLGDLLVRAPELTNVAYPSRKLPDATPLAPLTFENVFSQSSSDPATNPNLTAGGGGYDLFVCNSSSSKTHIVNSVSARIERVIPYTGALSAWNLCDGLYNAEAKQNEAAGCGGGFCANEAMNAVFAPNAEAGATVTTTQLSSDKDIAGGCGGAIVGPLPVSLKPLHGVSINVGIVAPTRPASYAWAFGLAQDSSAPTFVPASRPALVASVSHKWSGAGCLRPEMQAQIPASSTDMYVCPES